MLMITISQISFQKKYKVIIPGEMIFLNIEKEHLKGLGINDTLVVNASQADLDNS